MDGRIVLKNYLKGNPEVYLSLSPDFQVLSRPNPSNGEPFLLFLLSLGFAKRLTISSSPEKYSPNLKVDDLNFHHNVRHDAFDKTKGLSIKPPDGETVVLTYRISEPKISIPFRITHSINLLGRDYGDVTLSLHPNFSSDFVASNITISMFLPPNIISSSFNLTAAEMEETGINAEFRKRDQLIVWHIDHIEGGENLNLKAKLSWTGLLTDAHREIGPVS